MNDHKGLQPQPYPQYQNGFIEEEEINLLDYWRVLMKRKWMILSLIFAAIISSVFVSLLMPNIYRAEVVIAPVEKKGSSGGVAAFMGQFNGLASITGISLGNESNEIDLAILKSRTFIKKVVKENNLMPILFIDKWDKENNIWIETDPELQPTLWDAYRLLDNILTVSTDRKSDLTKVALERTDPEQAASLLTLFIESLGKHLKDQAIKEAEANIEYLTKQIEDTPLLEMRQALYTVIAEQTRQIMLAKAQQYFSFKIIDPPEIPDKKYKPNRRMIVILFTLLVNFIAIFIAFFLEYLEKQKNISN
ncbi:MAG: Wzz/FepE/Etk N-terminal domain-containing protein [bacterium]